MFLSTELLSGNDYRSVHILRTNQYRRWMWAWLQIHCRAEIYHNKGACHIVMCVQFFSMYWITVSVHQTVLAQAAQHTHSLTQNFKLPKWVQLGITARSPLIIDQSKAVECKTQTVSLWKKMLKLSFFLLFINIEFYIYSSVWEVRWCPSVKLCVY